MFQRLSNLLFGEVEVVSADLNGPKPCVTEADEEGWLLVNLPEGAPAQASPMEDLLIEHPSMSVYVASGNLSVVEQSAASLAGSVSTMSESALPPVARSSKPTRMARGAAHQALAKVTQASRVQRAKARVERRPLGRHRMQRQNHVCQQIPRHSAHTRNAFLHQPCQRGLCH
ncbi:tumor protein p53-inducible nuclear protein 2 isoform X2 [Electrophorus electricus]|uniref:tumor protein p53-inducible nuclear protein 2 isoform X2 n=1 Tax=Electrophorus electricus TaxID=8005 RepID=UPI0015D01582|nr:tumor protein p53-inducible nuclear protein 2 isoform X2 [Electrophorus electricus]